MGVGLCKHCVIVPLGRIPQHHYWVIWVGQHSSTSLLGDMGGSESVTLPGPRPSKVHWFQNLKTLSRASSKFVVQIKYKLQIYVCVCVCVCVYNFANLKYKPNKN